MKALFWIVFVIFAMVYWIEPWLGPVWKKAEEDARRERLASDLCKNKTNLKKTPIYSATDAAVVGFTSGFAEGYCK